jgi:hypothetical protein
MLRKKQPFRCSNRKIQKFLLTCLHISETQYRRWFREWGVRKRVVGDEKIDIVNALGRRKRDDTSTSNVLITQDNIEKEVDKKQLKRHLRDRIRHHHVEAMSPGVSVFTAASPKWSMLTIQPFQALIMEPTICSADSINSQISRSAVSFWNRCCHSRVHNR